MPHSGDRSATHQARRSGAAVDVDLAAMPVSARCTAGARRIVLGTHGVDPAETHSLAHQSDQVCPQLLPVMDAQLMARFERIKLVAEQYLRAVDIADAGRY